MGCGTRLFRRKEASTPGAIQDGRGLSTLMVEDHTLISTHRPRVIKKSKTVCTSRSRNVISTKCGQPKGGGKSTLENLRRSFGILGKCAAKSIFLAMALWNRSLQGVQTVSSGNGVIVVLFWNGLCTLTLSLLSPCGPSGLNSVSRHSAVSVCLD